MAHVLTDEAFALTLGHFRRLGRADPRGYWIAAIGSTFIPWNIATIVGFLVGGQLIDRRSATASTSSSRRRWPGSRSGSSPADARSSPSPWRSSCRSCVADRLGPTGGGGRAAASSARSPGSPLPGTGPSRSRRSELARRRRRCGSGARPADRGRAVSVTLVGLALLMGAVTYPSRACPLLAPGIERLPPIALAYLRLVGPAILAALAAVNTVVVIDDADRGDVPRRHRVAVGRRVRRDRRLAEEPVPRPRRGGGGRRRRPGQQPRVTRPIERPTKARRRSRPPRCESRAEGHAGDQPRRASTSISTSRLGLDEGADLDDRRGRPDRAEQLPVDGQHGRRRSPCRSRTSGSGRRRRARSPPRRGRPRCSPNAARAWAPASPG